MSSSFILQSLPLPRDTNTLQWDRLDAWLADADQTTLDAGYDEAGWWDEDEATPDAIRALFAALRAEIDEGWETATMETDGQWSIVSGGMSSGDDPTEAAGVLRRAWAFSGALVAIGFPIAPSSDDLWQRAQQAMTAYCRAVMVEVGHEVRGEFPTVASVTFDEREGDEIVPWIASAVNEDGSPVDEDTMHLVREHFSGIGDREFGDRVAGRTVSLIHPAL